jgi:hypothetical protein
MAIFVSCGLIHATTVFGNRAPKLPKCRDLHSFVDVPGHAYRAHGTFRILLKT